MQVGSEGQIHHYLYFLMFFRHLFIFERERERVSRGGAEREGDTEPEADSRL